MNRAEILKRIRTIEIATKGLSKDLYSGQYKTAFKGRGMSFAEVRDYHYGDEIRAIDWNVTARYNTPFVKVFEEERELTVMVLIDVSASFYYGTDQHSKIEKAIEFWLRSGSQHLQTMTKPVRFFIRTKLSLIYLLKKEKNTSCL